MFFTQQESYRKGVIASTLLNVIARIIGFANSLFLLFLFGATFGTDVYFLIISTVGFIASFMLGMITYVVIPEAMRIRINFSAKQEQAYINYFIWMFAATGVLLGALICIGPSLFYSFFSRYPGQELSQFSQMLIISAILFPLTFITNLIVFVLSSHKFFTIPMLVSIINSCISIALLIILKSKMGISAAVLAYTAGMGINLLWLIWILKKRLQWNFFRIQRPTKKNWHNILLMELNIIPVSLRSFVNIYLLSGLGAGIVTSYNYGMQMALIPELMIISQVSAVSGIKFNELSAQGRTDEINTLFFKIMKMLLFALLPVAILLFLISGELLQVLFTFKKNGDIGFITAIAAFMATFALTLPGRALDVVISSIMTAQQKIRQGVVYAVFLHLSVILFTILAVYFFGLKGFYYIIPAVYIFYIPIFYLFFTKRVLPFVELSKWFKESMPYIVLLSVTAVGIFYIKEYLAGHFGAITIIGFISLFVTVAALLINKLLKYQPLSYRF